MAKKRSAAEIAAAMMGGSKPAAVASRPASKVAAKTVAPKAAAKPAAAKTKAAAKPAAAKAVASKAAAKSVASKAAGKVTSTLADCARLVEAGELAELLEVLLEAWRDEPSIALGDVIVRVGALAKIPSEWTPKGPPHPAAITNLLETLLAKGSKQGRERLEAMARWPGDPRIDRWVAQCYVDVPYTSTGARPFWTRLLPLATRIADPAAWATLVAARAQRGQDWVAEYLDRIMQRGEVPNPAPAPEVVAAIAAIDQAVATRASAGKHKHADTAAELLAAVLAHPDDEHARLVLADVLLEQGHPRGELIALQTRADLSPADRKREKQIVKEHFAELTGTLAPALKADACTFARGFLARAVLRAASSGVIQNAIDRCVGDPLWATVEHVDGSDYEISRHPVMRSLRSLASTHTEIEWCARHPRLESLTGGHFEDDWLPHLAAQDTFPALRELGITLAAHHVEPLIATRVVTRLERLQLRFHVSQRQNDVALAAIAQLGRTTIPDVTLTFDRYSSYDWSCSFRLVRGPEGLAVTVSTTNIADNWEPFVAEDLLRGLDLVAELRPASITLAKNLRVAQHARRIVARVAQLAG